MNVKKTILLFVLFLNISIMYADSNYHLNEELIETAFTQSEDITMAVSIFTNSNNHLTNFSIPQPADDNTQIYAAIAGAFGLLLGIGVLIPVHRLILGTNGHFGKVCALYCITLSGCGIITLIDIFMMLVDDTKSKYINNPKFIMWAN